MSEQDVETSRADEAEEVLDVIFPSGDEAAEVVHPREEPLDFPASAVAAQLASILAAAPVAPVGGDHLDAVFLLEHAVERVPNLGLVADQPGGEPAPPRPTVHRSVPSVLSRRIAVSQSSPRAARILRSAIYGTGSRLRRPCWLRSLTLTFYRKRQYSCLGCLLKSTTNESNCCKAPCLS